MPEADTGVLPRPRLVMRLLASGASAVVAPGGFGKSTLLAEAAHEAGSPVVDVVAAPGTDAPPWCGSWRVRLDAGERRGSPEHWPRRPLTTRSTRPASSIS